MAFFRAKARQRRGKGEAKAGQKAGFRVMLKYFEIKKAFRYYIKQRESLRESYRGHFCLRNPRLH